MVVLALLPALALAQAPCALAYTTGGTSPLLGLHTAYQQSFTATCSGKLTTMVFTFPSTADDFRSNGQYVVQASLKDAAGTTTLATAPRTDQVFPGGTTTFDFSAANALLTSGTQYRWELLEIETSTGLSNYPVYLLQSYLTDPYPGGQAYGTATNGGSAAPAANRDWRGWTVNIGLAVQAGTISSPLCAGSAVAIPFTAYGTIGSGNTYTAQLSNASGSFAAPVTIGTLSSTAATGTISATVPAGTASGTGYRIQVVASTAGFSPIPNTSDLTITNTAAPTGAASQSFSSGATVANLAATGTALQWYAASAGGSPLAGSTALVNGTTYYATQTAGGCESTSRFAVAVAITAPVIPVQVLTSAGGTLFVNAGGTLVVNGHLRQTGAALLRTTGAATVRGDLTSTTPAALDLSTGTLAVTSNLSNTGPTTATTGTLLLNGTTNQTVDLAGGTVGQLVVSKSTAGGTRVDLPTDLTALTGLTLTAGSIRTAATATLSLPAGATVAGEGPGHYVQGNLRVSRTVAGPGSVDFGLGFVLNSGGQNMGPVTVTRTAGLQTVGVSYGQNLAGTAKGIDRVWRVSAALAPTAPVSVTLSWVADDDNGFVATTPAKLWRADQPSGPWSPQGSAANASARSFTANASQLGVLTVSNTTQPLPVELVSFAAQRQGEAAYLTWATASEKNSAYFEAEASPDGTAFRPVGRVAAQGNSTQHHNYSLTDANLTHYAAPLVYYRLRQVDQDGTASYSTVRTLAVSGAPVTFRAAAWPNPAQPGVTTQLQVSGPDAGQPVELTLTDAAGRVLARRTVSAASGPMALPEADGRAAGVYLLRVRQGASQQMVRLLRK
ncbi:hypothetical protein GCM10027044_13960 [Hymenobacter ruber]